MKRIILLSGILLFMVSLYSASGQGALVKGAKAAAGAMARSAIVGNNQAEKAASQSAASITTNTMRSIVKSATDPGLVTPASGVIERAKNVSDIPAGLSPSTLALLKEIQLRDSLNNHTILSPSNLALLKEVQRRDSLSRIAHSDSLTTTPKDKAQ